MYKHFMRRGFVEIVIHLDKLESLPKVSLRESCFIIAHTHTHTLNAIPENRELKEKEIQFFSSKTCIVNDEF